jgi:D-alanyl-D-alanine carboxypeptidase (penicillin-binding protein 5/6)
MRADNHKVLFSKKEHEKAFPASVTKIATALFAVSRSPIDQTITVTPEALTHKYLQEIHRYKLATDGTKMGIVVGETLLLQDLLYGLLLSSGNDAANAIAFGLAPSMEIFMEEFGRYLNSLGCQNTTLQNPHGLHHEEHLSSAYDLALIASEALKLDVLRKIVQTTSYIKPKSNKQKPFELIQSNLLIRKQSPYFDPRAIGMKTGYTSKAGYTLIAAAKVEDRELIAVLLGEPSSKARYLDAKRLFDAAFAEQKIEKRFFGPEHFFTRPSTILNHPIQASPALDLKVSFYPSEEPSYKASIHWQPLCLPIKMGDIIGTLQLVDTLNGPLIEVPLLAKESIELTWWEQIKLWWQTT